MRYVSLNYNYSPDFTTSQSWLDRVKAYNGILTSLARQHEVISIKQIGYNGVCLHEGVEHHFTDFEKKTWFPVRLNKFISDLQPDIVVVQGLHKPLQVVLLRLLLNKKVKIIAHHHAERPFTGIKKYAQRLADKFINAYLFASRDMGLDWVKRGNLASAQKIHEVMEVSSVFYPVDKNVALSKTNASGNLVFLWVGRLNENKDPLTVLKAFLRYIDHEPSARLYMIYHTDELLPQINHLLSGHRNKNSVKLIGRVPNSELLYWYNSADFILSGSHYEGSGTAVCEAMSCGCIPVITDIFSFRMITDNGQCGFLYEPGNEDALLAVLLNTPQLNRQQKRAKCLEYFRSNLSFDAIARRIDQIVASL